MAIDYEALTDSPHLLDVLIQMEDILDSFDIYVFKNWSKGEVVDGPIVRRYWFDFTLQYPKAKMPDPRGAMRLIKHGIRVDYNKATIENKDGTAPKLEETDSDADAEIFTHWNIKVSIPKRLISDMNAAELDFYDADIDVEDIQDAQDEGMDGEDGLHADDMNDADSSSSNNSTPSASEMP